MVALRTAIYSTLEADHPQTVRGLYYQLVSQGIIEKTEAAYKGIVVRLATEMRLDGSLPFNWLADATRWVHGGTAFESPGDWLRASLRSYRLDLWRDQAETCEVWLEKEALSGVLLRVTDPWCVPLMVCRGYPSISYLAAAAANLKAVGKPAHLYYLGDYDPSGVDISRNVEQRLRQFAPSVSITFSRIAVTPAQIREFKLPTRPNKTTDSRAGSFKGKGSVEVDSIPAKTLRGIVEKCVLRHLDMALVEKIRQEERFARADIEAIKLPGWGGADVWDKRRAWGAWLDRHADAEARRRWPEAIESVEGSSGLDELAFGPDQWLAVADLAGASEVPA